MFAGRPSDGWLALPFVVSGAALAVLGALLLLVSGQPLFTDDAWLHLALGEAYAAQGPWLDADPLLATSLGPPTPAAWLFDLILHLTHRTFGFEGLRVLHVGIVAIVIVLVWRAMRRASDDPLLAHLGTALFLVLAAYRLIQLRPHLFTILAVLLLYGIAFQGCRRLSLRDVATIALLCAVWVNMHAAFLLGPILLTAGGLGLVAARPIRGIEQRDDDLRRAGWLFMSALVGGIATFLNPAGSAPHLAYVVAGNATPSLGRVADEWPPVDLMAWPPVDLPPSWLSWVILWCLVLGTLSGFVWILLAWSRARRGVEPLDPSPPSFDPALLALAVVGCALPLVAVRFLWLGLLPLVAFCDGARRSGELSAPHPEIRRWTAAAIMVAVVPAFLLIGPWPMIRAGLPSSWAGYRQPYHAGKYHANLVWMIHDAELEGTLFTDYHIASFAGRHLSPRVKSLVNGTLNVTPDVIAANLPLRLRRGELAGERFVDLLDRHEVDLFVGIRLPRFSMSARPWFHTTAHLERTEGWLTVFRNLNGAVYLRADDRNQANLERVVAYYEAQGIPFDPAVGFDVARAITTNRAWATGHGIVPRNFDRLTAAAHGSDRELRAFARPRLASIYATLGLYERALEIDLVDLEYTGVPMQTRRRVVWSLLRLGRFEEAAESAAPLTQAPPRDPVSRIVAEGARRAAAMDDDEERASLVATLPLFTRAEVAMLMMGFQGPSPRPEL